MAIPSIVNCATFYVLSKIPKPTLSFYPIVSSIRADFYKLVRFLSPSFTLQKPLMSLWASLNVSLQKILKISFDNFYFALFLLSLTNK